MKSVIVIMTLILSSVAFAGATRDLNRGLSKGYVKLKDVKVNNWLSNIEAKLELKYDFHENVSYVFEDIDEVAEDCDFAVNDDVDLYDQLSTEANAEIVWKKAVKRKKSRAYVAFLVVEVDGPMADGSTKTCDVLRGAYAVDRKGKDITDRLTVDLERFYKR